MSWTWCVACTRPCPGRDPDGFCSDVDRAELARRSNWLRTGRYEDPQPEPPPPPPRFVHRHLPEYERIEVRLDGEVMEHVWSAIAGPADPDWRNSGQCSTVPPDGRQRYYRGHVEIRWREELARDEETSEMTMTVDPPARLAGVTVRARVAWTDPDGTEACGTVVSVDDGGLVVNKDRIGQTRLRWNTEGLRLLDGSAETEAPAEGGVMPRGIITGPTLLQIQVGQIELNPRNPRQVSEADDAAVAELAEDIKARGLINPITVRETGDEHRPYEVITGERRYRACLKAGLTQVLCINRGAIPAEQAFEETLRENALRQDLNPLEEARAVEQALAEFHWSQEKIGTLLGGKSQSWISRTRALLRLPGEAQELIKGGKLLRSMGEELLTLAQWPKDLVRVAQVAADEEWTAAKLSAEVRERRRQLEARDQPKLFGGDEIAPAATAPAPVAPAGPTSLLAAAERELDEVAGRITEMVYADEPAAPTAQGDSTGAITTASQPTAPSASEALTSSPAEPEPETTPETKPNALKSAEELVAEKHGAAVPTTVGAATLDAPVAMCMVTQDCVTWLRGDGFNAKDFLFRLKSAAYTRGLSAAEILTQLETA
ncbi:MAG: ParB/RepB/Spo0J family partition protein [Armatimonadota bacterium]